jgi:8-oxo-dGTP pyrophosphatase MutT (NUDIX family)
MLPEDSLETTEEYLTFCRHWIQQEGRTHEEILAILENISDRTGEGIALIASAVAIVDESGDSLVLRRGPTAPYFPGMYCFPGGVQDPEDDSLEITAKRELREEAGLVGTVTAAHGTHFSVVPHGKRVFEVSRFEMHLDPGSSRQITLSREHDHFLWENPSTILQSERAGKIILDGETTRDSLRLLLNRKHAPPSPQAVL